MVMQKRIGGAKVTPQTVREIRREYAEGATQPELARKWKIGVGQVGRIVRGEAWVNVSHGERVVTDQEMMLHSRDLNTPQGQEYIRSQTQGMAERLLAMQEEMGIGMEKPPSTSMPLATHEANERYKRLMGIAVAEADAVDGTHEAVESAAAKLGREIEAQAQAQSPIEIGMDTGKINAGKLLETLKDEHEHNHTQSQSQPQSQSTERAVPPATPE